MKDTLLTVPFKEGEIKIWHKSMMGSLQDVFQLGNVYRAKTGFATLPLSAWIQRQDVQEYIAFLTEKMGTPATVTKRGKNGGTFAHLKVLIDAATSLSPEFKDEVYDAFIGNKLLMFRDDSGERFKDINILLKDSADAVLGKPSHVGHYIQVAKAIRDKILDAEHPGWDFANAYELQQRYKIEEKIATLLELGVVTNWDHLKELIERL